MNTLLYLAIFLLPFNGLPVDFIGIIGKQASIYFFLPFTLLYIVKIFFVNKAAYGLDKKFFILVFILFLIITLSFLINKDSILGSYYLNMSGFRRFIEQFLQLFFGITLSVTLANYILEEKKLSKIIKVARSIIILFCLYGIFQYLSNKVGGITISMRMLFESLILPSEGVLDRIENGKGIYSFSQEPSMLAAFFICLAPFVLSFEIDKRKYLLSFLVFLVLILSYSRIGYLVAIMQIILFLVFTRYGYLSISRFLRHSLIIFSIIGIIIITPLINVIASLFTIEEIGSNITRYGIAYSAVMVFLDNNLFLGVGLGQYGFYGIEFIPDWGIYTNETQDIINQKRWPFTHNLFLTFLAETGIFGLISITALLTYPLVRINKILKNNQKISIKLRLFGVSSYVSLFGTILSLLSREPISNLYIWFSLGMALVFINQAKKINQLPSSLVK